MVAALCVMNEIGPKTPGFSGSVSAADEGIVRGVLDELGRADEPLVFVLDRASRKHLYLHGPSERLLGLTREQMLADADGWRERLEPSDRLVIDTLRRDLDLHGEVMRVLRVVRPDGHRLTLRAKAMVRRVDGREVVAGSVVELGMTVDDPQFAGLFRVAVERTHAGVAVTDSAGRLLYLNREHVEMFGYDRVEELVGRSWRVLYSDEGVRRIEQEVFPEMAAKGVWRGQLRAKRRDGSLFHEQLTLSLMPDGGIVCNCRDVSDQVELAERLAAGEAMFRTFLNGLPTAVTIRNLSGAYEFVNDATKEFLGREMRRGGKERSGMEVCISEHRVFAYWGAADERVAKTGVEVRFDFPVKWGGRDWILDVKKMPLRINSGDVTHVCTLINDVTELRRMEIQKAESARRSHELHEMQREFISMVSHEFRTPLMSMQGVHYLLEKLAAEMAPAEAAKLGRLLKLQERAHGTLRELVDQVLQLNRIEHMSADKEPEPLRLAEFLPRTVDALNVAVANHRIKLRIELPSDYAAAVDEAQMRVLVENLISNGLKYSPETEPVLVTLRGTDEAWTLEVADRGRGIPPADQSKLFQAFYRASNVGKVAGTGLGLMIVRRVTDFHRGKLAFTSALGQGTAFTLTFPRDAAREVPAAAVPLPPEPTGAGEGRAKRSP